MPYGEKFFKEKTLKYRSLSHDRGVDDSVWTSLAQDIHS